MSDPLEQFALLASLGLFVGMYGTLVGVGGGFLLVPALLFLMPETSPASVTSISLAVVFFNAYAGTMAYARLRRIDYYAAALFIAAGLPGALFGTYLSHQIERAVFEPAFGVLLLAGGVWLVLQPVRGARARRDVAAAPPELPATHFTEHRAGRFNTLVGSIGSAYIGLVSSLFGIGGGVIQVPFFVRVLGFPPHVATATSQLVLAVLTLAGTISHLALGSFDHGGLDRTMFLAVGVMMGAPIGAAISTRLRGSVIVRLLAVALGLVGLRLVAGAVWK